MSIQLESGLLAFVMKGLEEQSVVVDDRKPDVIRVAPAPLYNSYVEVWDFVQIFESVCSQAVKERGPAVQQSAHESNGTDELVGPGYVDGR